MTATAKKHPLPLPTEPYVDEDGHELEPPRTHGEIVSFLVSRAGGLTWRQNLLIRCIGSCDRERVAVSLDTLAGWSGMSARLCERIVNDLEDLGLVTVWRAIKPRQRRARPVAYRIRLDRLADICRRPR